MAEDHGSSAREADTHRDAETAVVVIDQWADFEGDVIAFDPFAGDFGGSDDQPFVDKMVTARKPHSGCHCCLGPIEMGERHRYKCDKYDGELMSWRWCWACCIAMARSWMPWAEHEAEPPYAEIENRYGLYLATTASARGYVAAEQRSAPNPPQSAGE